MCQQLVDLTEFAKLFRCPVEAQQPLRVTTSLQELGHVGAHQVRTLVAGSCLWREVISLSYPPSVPHSGKIPLRSKREKKKNLYSNFSSATSLLVI